MVLRFIPKQERCCFCFLDLNVAAVVAVVFSMAFAVYDMTVVHLPLCHDLFKGNERIFKVLFYFSYLRLVGGCFTFLFAILFLIINVIMKKSLEYTSDCFASLIVFTLFVRSMCISLISVRLIKFERDCKLIPVAIVDIGMFILLTIIIFDFAISVNGYNFEVKMFGDDVDNDDGNENENGEG